jgi:hypothetical protein
MADFPTREADIVALANDIATGLATGRLQSCRGSRSC